MKFKTVLIFFAFILAINIVISKAKAQEYTQHEPTQKNYQGTIENISSSNGVRAIDIKITNKDKQGIVVKASMDQAAEANKIEYKVGDKVLILELIDPTSQLTNYYITDFNRTNTILWLFLIFCGVVISVSKKWGVYSLLGMLYSFFIIFKFILPQLLKGHNPLIIAILGALFIAPITFYLSHGINRKTTVALVSTLISLFITGILSLIFINLSKLTGFGSDEAFFLQIAKDGVVNIKGIFLAGIIIGTLGILDDVTISQASIVYQLKNSIRGINSWELYKKAMAIGHDHIASTVNTLILVYTGAALPLLLLFTNSANSFREAINAEVVADEIVRTLVGSIGLVLAVPISTVLAVYFTENDSKIEMHKHRH